MKSAIWTQALSQKRKLEFGALDRWAILALYEEEQHLFFMFLISHINFLYSFANFEPNVNFFDISYAPSCKMFP